MKDILLVKPYRSSSAVQTYPPIGLGFISSYLKKRGYSVDLLDCDLQKITPSMFSRRVDVNRYRVIGFQLFTLDMGKVKQYLEVIKNNNNNIITVVGGAQAASDPVNTLEYLGHADFAVHGEGEASLAAFLGALHNNALDNAEVMKDIPNLVWKYNDEYRVNSLKFEQDLDAIGYPDWEAINPAKYDAAVHGFFCKKLPTCPIIITRGCPYRCKFCGGRNITGYKVRTRDCLGVIEEIKLLKYKYGIREFQVVDDNFTANKINVMRFCENLIKEKIDMPWSCPNGIRLDTLDEELLGLMHRAGCYEVAVGIESGNQKILNKMRKGVTVKLIRDKVKLIHKNNIGVIGFIMVGYPQETPETIEESRKLALELPLSRVSLTRFAPFPGTPIAEELVQEGKISRDDLEFSNLSYMKFSYIPQGLTKKQLKWLFLKFFVTFYFRPNIILKNIRGIHSFKHFLLIFKKVLNFIFGI